MSDIPECLLPYCKCPAKILSPSTRVWLSKHLNPEIDSFSSSYLLKDWRGVAESLGYSSLDVDNFALDKNPTVELLRQWTFPETSTVGKLLEALEAVERFDVLGNDKLVTFLEKDCSSHLKAVQAQKLEASGEESQPIQVDEVTSVDEGKYITVNEAVNGVPEYFDAFVCYTHEDFDFVKQMIDRLEMVHGLKLCIVNRDLMPGCAKFVIMAKLIKERCRKMIIILSPDYINSNECEFQTRFAHSLAPGAKEKKLIPVIYRPCVIPSILNHICTVDYTRCELVEWFWERLANSLKNAQRENSLIPEPQSVSPKATSHICSSTVEPGLLTSTGIKIQRCIETAQTTQVNPSFSEIPGLLAVDLAADLSRTSSANSFQETGSNASWTEVSFSDDHFMSTIDGASSSFELDVEPPSVKTEKKKFLKKWLNPFKKH